MNDSAAATPTVEYKVVLADSASKMILAVPDGNSLRLPRVLIPKWTRPAEEITRELRDNWNLNTVVLSLLPIAESQPACAVAEVMDTHTTESDPALRLTSIEEIDRTDLDLGEQEHVRGVLTGSHKPSGPFSRPGWLREAQVWIKESLPDRRIDFTDDFRQYNASESFALVQFVLEEGRSIWLKATGDPNMHEFGITVRLSRLFPDYLPRLIAARADWNAWVTEDAGTALGGCQDLPTLLRAVEALAEFQIESLGEVDLLRAAGCMDRSLRNVQTHLGQTFDFLEEAMRLQVSTRSKPLAPARLREISQVVDEACTEMIALAIPPCLVNGDINLDNILFDGNRYSFIDWAEAGIGNPFLTLQQMIQNVIRDGEHLEWVPALCVAYRAKWLPLLGGKAIDRAFSLMPLLTMADYLYGRGDWLVSQRREEASFQSFARTLGRRMDRAAAELLSKEALYS